MENIEIKDALEGTVLAEDASALTQGLPGPRSETFGFVRHV
jgi:hypothetical protein